MGSTDEDWLSELSLFSPGWNIISLWQVACDDCQYWHECDSHLFTTGASALTGRNWGCCIFGGTGGEICLLVY